MPNPQITMRELLRDPIYKAWLQRPPNFDRPMMGDRPYVLWQLTPEGKWQADRFATYVKTYNAMIHALKAGALDAACNYPGRPSTIPKVKRQGKVTRWALPEDHQWCPYCRRPTRWGYYHRGHHAFPPSLKSAVDPAMKRCRICGVRWEFARRAR